MWSKTIFYHLLPLQYQRTMIHVINVLKHCTDCWIAEDCCHYIQEPIHCWPLLGWAYWYACGDITELGNHTFRISPALNVITFAGKWNVLLQCKRLKYYDWCSFSCLPFIIEIHFCKQWLVVFGQKKVWTLLQSLVVQFLIWLL